MNVLGSALFRDSFGAPTMRAVFDDHKLVRKYVEVEVASTKARTRCGVVPEAATQEIAEKCSADTLDFDLLCHETEIVGYPILPLVHQISKRAGESGGYVYWGAAAQDIMGIAVVLQIHGTFTLTESDMDKLRTTLVDLSRRYRDTSIAGRTHLQQALPATFGCKTAIWLDMFERHAECLSQARSRVLVGEFMGVAGTPTSLGDRGLATRKAMMEELGSDVPTFTWRVARDGFTETMNLLVVITGSLGKIVYDVMLLAVNEFGELYESFVKGYSASSTMSQRRNPISNELMSACARGTHQQAGSALDTVVQDLECATGPWHAEWIVIPENFVLSAGVLHQANFMLVGLVVDEEVMGRNPSMTNGLIVAEAVMMGLVPYIGRQNAHDMVHSACRTVNEQGGRLADVLDAMSSVSERLDSQLIEKLTDPANYFEMASAIVDQALARYMLRK